MDVDLVQLAILGFSTGIGSAFATELVKTTIQTVKKKVEENRHA